MMLAGLLAQAGIHDGLHVVQTQSYGPEARLGAAKSDVVLSPHEIAFPEIVKPDLILCLSRDAYVTYGRRLAEGGRGWWTSRSPGGLDVGDDDLVLPLSRSAGKVGDPLVANTVALGALVALRSLVSRGALPRGPRAGSGRVPGAEPARARRRSPAGGQGVPAGARRGAPASRSPRPPPGGASAGPRARAIGVARDLPPSASRGRTLAVCSEAAWRGQFGFTRRRLVAAGPGFDPGSGFPEDGLGQAFSAPWYPSTLQVRPAGRG